jgi:hypothetical protein
MSTQGADAPMKKFCRWEANNRTPGFDVAAVTVEISAVSIRFDCNRRPAERVRAKIARRNDSHFK